MPAIGDLRVVEFDPGEFEIELFANHNIPGIFWCSEPFWALRDWAELGISELAGPFASAKEAKIQIRIFKNNADKRLDKLLI